MSCDFAHEDGAYVLGALSPTDRLAFERHLPGCADCAHAVQRLAGLPGLLGRVRSETLESPPPPASPVPETLLPALVREVRRTQRQRFRLTAGIAAAAALVVTAGGLAVANAVDTGGQQPGATSSFPGAPASTAPARAMTRVGGDAVSGELALTSVAWGTRLDLSCSYETERYDPTAAATYAMFVRSRDGRVERVATWRGLPGRTMTLDAATATRREDIASVEVRTADGRAVLTLAS